MEGKSKHWESFQDFLLLSTANGPNLEADRKIGERSLVFATSPRSSSCTNQVEEGAEEEGTRQTRREMVSQSSSPLDHVAARGVIFVAAAFFAAAGSSPSAFAFPFEDAGNNRRETLTKYFPSGDTGML